MITVTGGPPGTAVGVGDGTVAKTEEGAVPVGTGVEDGEGDENGDGSPVGATPLGLGPGVGDGA